MAVTCTLWAITAYILVRAACRAYGRPTNERFETSAGKHEYYGSNLLRIPGDREGQTSGIASLPSSNTVLLRHYASNASTSASFCQKAAWSLRPPPLRNCFLTVITTGMHAPALLTDVDTPLLQAGLMGTLHAILDEPAAAKVAEPVQGDALQNRGVASPSPSASSIAAAATAATEAPGSAAASSSTVPGTATPLGSPPGDPAAGRKAADRPSSPSSGGHINVKKIVSISQHKKKNREHLMRASPDTLDRILAVSGGGGARVGEQRFV